MVSKKEHFHVNIKDFRLKFEKCKNNEDTELKYFFESNNHTIDLESLISFLEKINYNKNQIKKDDNNLWDEISDSISYIQMAHNSENIRLSILNLVSLLLHNSFLCKHSFILNKINNIKNHTSIPFFGYFVYIFLKLEKSIPVSKNSKILYSDYNHFNIYDIFYL